MNGTGKHARRIGACVVVAVVAVLAWASAAIADAGDATVSFGSTPANPTNSTTATFTFAASDPDPVALTFQCSLDAGAFSACASPDSFTVSEGHHTFQVEATDGTTTSLPTSYSWVVDTTAPNEAINTPTQGQAFTLDQNVASSFSCGDPTSGGVSSGVASCVGNVYYDGSASPTSTIHSGDPLPTDQQGPYELTVTGTDNAGNASTSAPVYYHVDPANYDGFTIALHPLAFYELDEVRGATTMTDSSGNGHHGTYQNNVRLQRPSALDCENLVTFTNFCTTGGDWYAGPTQGTSAFFNGQSNSGAHGYANNIPLPVQQYTLEAWVNPADRGDMGVLQHGSGGALYIQNGRFVFNPSSNNTSPVITSAPVASYPGSAHNLGWHLLAGTWDGNTARLYVDGTEVGSATGVTGLSTSTSTLFVGLTNLSGLPTFHGLMDNVAYFDSAVGADEISDQWEIGTYSSYDYVPNWPTGADDMTAPLIYNFEPYNGAALSTDSNKKPFKFTFSTNDEDDSGTTCAGSLINGSSSTLVAFSPSPAPGNVTNWSAPIPDTVGSYAITVHCSDGTGNTTTRTYHYTYGHFAGVMTNDHPVAYYRLDELGAATTMIDSSGHGHNGEFKNDHSPFSAGVSGDSGTSRQFLGLGGYAYANGIAAPPEGYTLEGWVALRDTGNQSIVEHGGAGSVFVRGGRFVFRPNANVAVEVVGPGAGPCAPVANGSPLPANPTFQHFDATWDGVYASLYINGHLCSTIEASVPPFASGVSTFYLGFGSQEPWLRGALDEVSYYSFAFNSEQVTFHQLADPPLYPRGQPSGSHRPVKHKPKPKPRPKRHRRGKKN